MFPQHYCRESHFSRRGLSLESLRRGSFSSVWARVVCSILVVFVGFLSACAPRIDTVRFSDVSLRDVVAVFSVNPQHEDEVRRAGGYVVFLRKDGSYAAVKTAGMAYQQPLWTRNGLYFADFKNDYFIGEKSRDVRRNDKALFQNLTLETPQKSVMGIFDMGFDTDTDNRLQLIPLSSSGETRVVYSGILGSAAYCGKNLWGIREEGANQDFAGSGYLDLRNYSDSRQKVLSYDVRKSGFVIQSMRGTACLSDSQFLTIISKNKNEYYINPYVLKWDIRTDKRTIYPIRYSNGEKLTISNTTVDYNEKAISDDGMLTMVMDASGKVVQVDTDTGIIRRQVMLTKLPKGLSDDDKLQYKYVLLPTDRYYCIMRIRYGQAGKRTPTRLYFVGKRTWKVERVLTLNEDLSRILKGQREPYVFNEGVAVNPRI